MPRLTRGVCLLGILLLTADTAFAQTPAPQPLPEEPIGRFVVDVRGVMARFPTLPTVAAGLGVDPSELPGRGFGLSVGTHVYPLRRGSIALGVGAELLLRARGSHTRPPATTTADPGPTVTTTMTAFSPQVSLNFGKRDGWSYLSGGLGPASLASELDSNPLPDAAARTSALSYGGGARWFAKKHVAFTFDIRFYRIRPQEASIGRPAVPGVRVMVLSAGLSLR